MTTMMMAGPRNNSAQRAPLLSADFEVGNFDGNNAMPVTGGVVENRANIELVAGAGYNGTRGMRFNFLGTEENDDSWAEMRWYATNPIGRRLFSRFWMRLEAGINYPATGGTRNDKLFNAFSGLSSTDPNRLLVVMEMVPANYSLNGSLVTPSAAGLYPRLASAAAEPYETREPDRHDTWAIYAPLFVAAEIGAYKLIEIEYYAKVGGSYAKIWADGVLCGETIATDYSFLTPAWDAAGQEFENGYALGYAATGVLGQITLDDFRIYSSRSAA
jgi:hypothetical protein